MFLQKLEKALTEETNAKVVLENRCYEAESQAKRAQEHIQHLEATIDEVRSETRKLEEELHNEVI